jgi:hypothetical protein
LDDGERRVDIEIERIQVRHICNNSRNMDKWSIEDSYQHISNTLILYTPLFYNLKFKWVAQKFVASRIHDEYKTQKKGYVRGSSNYYSEE